MVDDEPDVKDGNAEHITREPEQVKAFRDTWRDGIHSYLTYLRDRLTVARDLLSDSGSIFVQIGDENVHRVRALLDEIFGQHEFCQPDCVTEDRQAWRAEFLRQTSQITFLWYYEDMRNVKYQSELSGKRLFGWRRGQVYRSVRGRSGHSTTLEGTRLDSVTAVPEGQTSSAASD